MGFEEGNEKKISSLLDIQEDVSNCISSRSAGFTTVFFDQLDQSQTIDNTSMYFYGGVSPQCLAQEFIPTLPIITKVEIKFEKKGNPTMTSFDVGIKEYVNGLFATRVTIDASLLGNGTSWLTCDIPDVSVTPGQIYYLVVWPSDGTFNSSNYFAWHGGTTDPYSGGYGLYNTGTATWFLWSNADFCFNTYGIPAGMNNPPNTPSQMSGPSLGNIGQSLPYTSSAIDVDGDTIRYALDVNNDGVVDHWSPYYYPSGATYTIYITFYSNGTYSLRLKAQDQHGAESEWSTPKYVTITGGGGNNSPYTPNTPSGPATGSMSTSYSYSTSGTDPDSDQVKYCFDWGDGSPYSWTSWVGSGSAGSASHSWSTSGSFQVKAKSQDEHGLESGWSSALTVTVSTVNNPPNKPITPAGSSSGKPGISYSYSSSSIDPDGNQVYLMFDWGDGTNTGWIGPFSSGYVDTESHIWTAKGAYSVKVQAKDTKDAVSIWSDPLPITMPYSYKPMLPFFELLFQRFPNVFPILRQMFE